MLRIDVSHDPKKGPLKVLLAVVFVATVYKVVSPFLEGILWGGVYVLCSWPLYMQLQSSRTWGRRAASFAMVLGGILVAGLLVIPLFFELGKEAYRFSRSEEWTSEMLTSHVREIPYVYDFVNSSHVAQNIQSIIQKVISGMLSLIGDVTQRAINLAFTIGTMFFASYFLFLHGETIATESRLLLARYGDLFWVKSLDIATSTIKGVLYGAFATALAQGALATAGFFVAGAPLPALLGLATMLISFVPFGAPFVYVPVCFYIAFGTGNLLAGTALLIWGIAVVSTSDNILRTVFISHTAKLSLFLVFIGVVGGIFAFGFIGLFLGPSIIAVFCAAWKELLIGSRELES